MDPIAADPSKAAAVEQYLADRGIEFERHEHPPVATVADAEQYWAGIDARHAKNLFLRNQKGTRHFLVVLASDRRADLPWLGELFGEKKLFAAGPLKDPTEFKRGIVIVKAASQQTLADYFQPDQYVREGYLKLNAAPALVNKPLATEGVDSSGIEEGRIVQVMRGDKALSSGEAAAQRAMLQRLVDQGPFGAWYTLESGPVAEVLFSRNKDDKALQTALATLPAVKGGAPVTVWAQWFAKGVLK